MKKPLSPSLVVLGICLGFSILFAWYCGPLGHAGDSWNYIYTSYGDDFFHPIWLPHMWFSQRPVEYVVQVYLLLKLGGIGFMPILTHLSSLLFLTGSVFLFSKFLEKLYPNERGFIIFCALSIFFYGPLFSLTFRFNPNSSLFSGIFFWGCALLFFYLDRRKKTIWIGLLCAILYLLSVFSYENYLLLIFILPVGVYLSRKDLSSMPLLAQSKRMLFFILPSIAIFALPVLIKFVAVEYVGYSTNISFIFIAKSLWTYSKIALLYEVDAIREVAASNYRYLPLLFTCIGFVCQRRSSSYRKFWYTPFILGGIIFIAGTLPYIIAGYSSTEAFPNYTGGARVFCSAAFGLGLMITGLIRISKSMILRNILFLLVAGLVSSHITFSFILADAWKEATRRQKSLYTSLLELCPNVEDNTTFIFLDAQSTVGNKASIFGGTNGTNAFIKTVYNNPTLQAGLAYSGPITDDEMTLRITMESIKTRGTYVTPLEKALIVKNVNYRFELVNLRDSDRLNAIWEQPGFEITKGTMQVLKASDIPEDIIGALKQIKWQRFQNEPDIIEAVKQQIGDKNMRTYQELILTHSWRDGIREVRPNHSLITRHAPPRKDFLRYVTSLPD